MRKPEVRTWYERMAREVGESARLRVESWHALRVKSAEQAAGQGATGSWLYLMR